MADIINNIGAGQTYTTVPLWWAARPNDGNNWIGNYVDTDTINPGELSGTNIGGAELRADSATAFDFEAPASAHPIFSSTSSPIYIRATDKFILRGFEVISTGTSSGHTLVKCGEFEDCDVEVIGCRLKNGFEGVGTSRAGAKIHTQNTVITGCQEFGIRGASVGVTSAHTVVSTCNQVGSGFRAGIQTTSGASFDSVVAFNNTTDDWFDSNATATNCASGDVTAFGSSAVTGVVDGDFDNTASDIWTSASGGALSGTGSGGTDIGLNLVVMNVVLILSPSETELIQRDMPANTADIAISGTYSGPLAPTAIEASFNGGSFATIDASPVGGSYSGTLSAQSSGNGDLVIRFVNDVSVISTQSNVAIGAKFLFWGQSNFSGRADNAQTYTGTAGFFHKYTVTTDAWEIGSDPFDTSTVTGSLFPLLANLLVGQLGVPVAFIGVAEGSTTLSQWQPGQTLNTRMIDFITNSGGSNIEAVASWIGESDATAGTLEATFKSEYNTVIDQLKTLTSIDSVLCGIAMAGTPSDNVRQWIQDIVSTNVNAVQYVDMAAEYTGVHYETNQETTDVSQALFDGLAAAYFNSVLNMTVTGAGNDTLTFEFYNRTTKAHIKDEAVVF